MCKYIVNTCNAKVVKLYTLFHLISVKRGWFLKFGAKMALKSFYDIALLSNNLLLTRDDLVAGNEKIFRSIFRKWYDIIDFDYR